MLQQNEIIRDGQGVERCHRIVETVLANDPKDATKGYKKIRAYCNKPVTLSISEGGKTCPGCEKQPPIGWASPKVTNAGDTTLTPKEMEECGLNPDGTRIDGKSIVTVKETIEAPKAVEAKVEVKKDEVVLNIPLKDLEASGDVAAYLVQKVIEGFGTLPTSNYGEAKRVMKLEEKLEALLRS